MTKINFGISAYERHKSNVSSDTYPFEAQENTIEISEQGNLSVIGPEEIPYDYQGFEKIKPELLTNGKVEIKRGEEFGNFEIREIKLSWIEPRQEWIAIFHRSWIETGYLEDEFYTGPFALDEMCANKILRAYGITEGKFSLDEVRRMCPERLKHNSQSYQ